MLPWALQAAYLTVFILSPKFCGRSINLNQWHHGFLACFPHHLSASATLSIQHQISRVFSPVLQRYLNAFPSPKFAIC